MFRDTDFSKVDTLHQEILLNKKKKEIQESETQPLTIEELMKINSFMIRDLFSAYKQITNTSSVDTGFDELEFADIIEDEYRKSIQLKKDIAKTIASLTHSHMNLSKETINNQNLNDSEKEYKKLLQKLDEYD